MLLRLVSWLCALVMFAVAGYAALLILEDVVHYVPWWRSAIRVPGIIIFGLSGWLLIRGSTR